MPLPDYKVLIADTPIHPAGIDLLAEEATLVELPAYSPEADLLEAIKDVDAILARGCVISSSVIRAAPKLKIVSRHGVGYDNVDIEECTRHGIVVSITANANAESVSEFAFSCLLAVANKLALAHAETRAGKWDRGKMTGLELHGKTLGIFGLGRIGSRTAKHARAFDMEVLACDPYIPEERARQAGATLVQSDALLRRADFVSIHVPLTPETRHMIGRQELEIMKPTAILVNTSRGGVVDEQALYQTLAAGRLFGAALDVFEQEPVRPDHPLLQLDNLLCSPHVAGVTAESMLRISVAAAENILQVLRGEPPSHVVNPEVLQNSSRVAWRDATG